MEEQSSRNLPVRERSVGETPETPPEGEDADEALPADHTQWNPEQKSESDALHGGKLPGQGAT